MPSAVLVTDMARVAWMVELQPAPAAATSADPSPINLLVSVYGERDLAPSPLAVSGLPRLIQESTELFTSNLRLQLASMFQNMHAFLERIDPPPTSAHPGDAADSSDTADHTARNDCSADVAGGHAVGGAGEPHAAGSGTGTPEASGGMWQVGLTGGGGAANARSDSDLARLHTAPAGISTGVQTDRAAPGIFGDLCQYRCTAGPADASPAVPVSAAASLSIPGSAAASTATSAAAMVPL